MAGMFFYNSILFSVPLVLSKIGRDSWLFVPKDEPDCVKPYSIKVIKKKLQ